jgi:heme A synthase
MVSREHPSERSIVAFRRFAWAFVVYTLGVILWGAFVRATGSGAGCGADWPTCGGEVVPRSPATETLIEYTHRLTSGLAWLLSAVMVVWARRVYPARHRVRRGAGLVLLFMTTEALVGAGLVLLEMVADNASVARAGWMAAHLLNTFLLLSALALTAWWASGGGPLRWRGRGSVAWLLGGAMVAVLVLGMSGAVTALGDTLFPADSLEQALRQDLSPAAHLFVRLRVLHPVLGLVIGALMLFGIGVAAAGNPSRSVRRAGVALGSLYLAQVGLGFVNVALLAPVWMQLVHLLVADLLWIGLTLFAALVLGAETEGAQSMRTSNVSSSTPRPASSV